MLEPGPVVTLNRVVATLSVVTFFWGWKRMMWIFGAKRQPSTTEPLRLTEMHMVVVCTWESTHKKSDYTTVTFTQWYHLSDSYSSGVLTWDWIYFFIELNSKVLPKPMRLKMYLKRMNPCAKQVCVPCMSNLMHTNTGIRDMHRQITFWWERGWINRNCF